MFANNIARTVLSATGALLIGGTLLVAATAPAAAAERTKTVSYADLNLASAQGRATLDARIKVAAKAVCSTGGSDLVSRHNETRCTRTAIATASRS